MRDELGKRPAGLNGGATEAEADRIEWIDVLKGIGIFFVTFAHLSPALPIEKHIYSFHMFLFFFISGYLFRKKDVSMGELIARKAGTLMIPFFVWDAAAAVYAYLVMGESRGKIIREFFLINGKRIWNAPIWFLYILFLTEVMFLIYDRYICGSFSGNRLVRLVIPAVCLYLTYRMRSNIHFKLGIVPMAFLFYWFGHAARECGLINAMNRSVYLWIVILAPVNIISSQINKRIAVINCDYGRLPLCYLAGITGVLLYVLLAGIIARTPLASLLRYLGQNSMILMCAQFFVFKIVTEISLKYTGTDLWHLRNTAKAFIMASATTAIILGISEVLKRRLPKRINEAIGIKG